MAFLSITRLRLRRPWTIFSFLGPVRRCAETMRTAPGYMAGYYAWERRPTVFWAISLWRDEDALARYRRSEAWRHLMEKAPQWCDEAAELRRAVSEPAIVSPGAGAELLRKEGAVMALSHPSRPHRAGLTWPSGKVPSNMAGTIEPEPPADP